MSATRIFKNNVDGDKEQTSIVDLPPEIIAEIAKKLGLLDVIKLAQVNNGIKASIYNTYSMFASSAPSRKRLTYHELIECFGRCYQIDKQIKLLQSGGSESSADKVMLGACLTAAILGGAIASTIVNEFHFEVFTHGGIISFLLALLHALTSRDLVVSLNLGGHILGSELTLIANLLSIIPYTLIGAQTSGLSYFLGAPLWVALLAALIVSPLLSRNIQRLDDLRMVYSFFLFIGGLLGGVSGVLTNIVENLTTQHEASEIPSFYAGATLGGGATLAVAGIGVSIASFFYRQPPQLVELKEEKARLTPVPYQ